MNLREANTLAVKLMDEHNLFAKGWRFQFDRARRRSGCCHYSVRMITVSSAYASLNEESLVRNTLLHEIAHALVGSEHGHDSVWRAQAIAIGSDGKSCIDANEVIMAAGSWQAICPGCGTTRHAYRRPRSQRSCGDCNPRHFDSRFLLTYRRVR